MVVKYVVAGALALGLLGGAVALVPTAIQPAYAACDPGTRLDGTTADQARRLMMRAGFGRVQVEQKGCDNVWHVIASKDGRESRYAIQPGGKIYPEGN